MEDGRFLTILKTILYGDLSKQDAEKLLQDEIDRELSGPLDRPSDRALVEKCQSLLWEMKTAGAVKYPDHALENKQKLIQKLNRPANRPKLFSVRKWIVAAAALVLLCGLSMGSIFWSRGTSTPDEQQYVIQSYRISPELIQKVVGEQEDQRLVTSSRAEAEAFLGFDLPVPETFLGRFACESYEINVLPIWVQCRCEYSDQEEHVGVTLYFMTGVEDNALYFEQDSVGEDIIIDRINVHAATNYDRNTLTWMEENVVYRVIGLCETDTLIQFAEQIIRR